MIDELARIYCETNKCNKELKRYIWGGTFRLYDHLKYFKKLRKYQHYYYRNYNSPEQWLSEIFTDCILECLKKFDIAKKKSFVGYTVDIFQNYRIKDAMQYLIKENSVCDIQSTDNHSEDEIYTKRENSVNHAIQSLDSVLESDGRYVYILFNKYTEKMISLILQFYGKTDKESKSKKLTKADYFQLIFSENIIQCLKCCGYYVDVSELENEEDIFKIMNLKWLDYLMTYLCRSYELIIETPLKLMIKYFKTVICRK